MLLFYAQQLQFYIFKSQNERKIQRKKMRFIRKQVGKGSQNVDGADSVNDPFNEILYRVPGNSMEAP